VRWKGKCQGLGLGAIRRRLAKAEMPDGEVWNIRRMLHTACYEVGTDILAYSGEVAGGRSMGRGASWAMASR